MSDSEEVDNSYPNGKLCSLAVYHQLREIEARAEGMRKEHSRDMTKLDASLDRLAKSVEKMGWNFLYIMAGTAGVILAIIFGLSKMSEFITQVKA